MNNEKAQYREVTLLLVDDDDLDVKGMKRALNKLKIANPVVRAKDGEEGLALLRDPEAVKRPYIILLDINMPRMNGIEMLTEVRKDPNLSDAIVFILTTSKSDEDKISSYKLNVAGYIVKSNLDDGFLGVMSMLDHYWRVVELPLNT
jgi:DNA-binding NarL/FixJ family response regulator